MLNLNATALKSFRDNLAIWSVTVRKGADVDLEKASKVKRYTADIEQDTADLAKLKEGKLVSSKTVEDFETAIASHKANLAAEVERLTTIKKEHMKSAAKCYEMYDAAGLGAAITAYANNIYDAEAEQGVLQALVTLFSNTGLEGVTVDDVRKFLPCASATIKKCTAKAIQLDGRYTGASKGNTMYYLFTGTLVEEPSLKAMLPEYKWDNIIERKLKKSEN